MHLSFRSALRALVILLSPLVMAQSCDAGGIGAPCIPEDEYRQGFDGFSESQVHVESRSFQCESRICMVAHFRGRVTCPYGQHANPAEPARVDPDTPLDQRCRIPGTDGSGPEDRVEAAVAPQLLARRPSDAVYCSCRCDGPNPNDQYCDCPSGFSCKELIADAGLVGDDAGGSYCVRDGTYVENPLALDETLACNYEAMDCGAPHPAARH